MKRVLSLIFIFCAITVMVNAQPQISFDSKSQNIGYILWRNPVTVKYSFTNTGDKPLVISNVTVSCGCMEADWTKEPVPAGGKGEVTAVYDAEAIGKFYREVGVYCNASNLPIYLDFSGEVTADPKDYSFTHEFGFGAIRTNKDEIVFDDVNKGDKPQFEILVANTSNKAYSPVLMHLPPYLTAKAEPEVLGSQKNGKITVTLHTDKLPKLGITRTTVFLSRFMGDKVNSENEIPVSVVLLPDFSLLSEQQKLNPPVAEISTTSLDYLGLKPKQKKSQTVVITNKGKSNLEILDLQVFTMALNVKVNKHIIKPGESAKMKVTVLAGNLSKSKGKPRVLMITNDPNNPKITININADIVNE